MVERERSESAVEGVTPNSAIERTAGLHALAARVGPPHHCYQANRI